MIPALVWARPEQCDELAGWAAQRIPHVGEVGFGPCQSAAVLQGDDILAVVVFHDWQKSAGTVQLSMAADSPRWASVKTLRSLFAYAFVGLGAHKLWTATPINNERALRFNAGVGLKREATLRDHFGVKRHAVICSMLSPEWRRSRWSLV